MRGHEKLIVKKAKAKDEWGEIVVSIFRVAGTVMIVNDGRCVKMKKGIKMLIMLMNDKGGCKNLSCFLQLYTKKIKVLNHGSG